MNSACLSLSVLPTNPEILLAIGKEEVSCSTSQKVSNYFNFTDLFCYPLYFFSGLLAAASQQSAEDGPFQLPSKA